MNFILERYKYQLNYSKCVFPSFSFDSESSSLIIILLFDNNQCDVPIYFGLPKKKKIDDLLTLHIFAKKKKKYTNTTYNDKLSYVLSLRWRFISSLRKSHSVCKWKRLK